MKLKTRLLISIIGIAFIFVSAGVYRWNVEMGKHTTETIIQREVI